MGGRLGPRVVMVPPRPASTVPDVPAPPVPDVPAPPVPDVPALPVPDCGYRVAAYWVLYERI